jgi:hypothetical protein
VERYTKKTLMESKISLFTLIENFINHTIINYCRNKLNFNLNNKLVACFLQPSILGFRFLHQNIGLHVVLGSDATTLNGTVEINEQHKEMLLKCGLVYREGNFFRFPHKLLCGVSRGRLSSREF